MNSVTNFSLLVRLTIEGLLFLLVFEWKCSQFHVQCVEPESDLDSRLILRA